jgi:hypothetical protein
MSTVLAMRVPTTKAVRTTTIRLVLDMRVRVAAEGAALAHVDVAAEGIHVECVLAAVLLRCQPEGAHALEEVVLIRHDAHDPEEHGEYPEDHEHPEVGGEGDGEEEEDV